MIKEAANFDKKVKGQKVPVEYIYEDLVRALLTSLALGVDRVRGVGHC